MSPKKTLAIAATVLLGLVAACGTDATTATTSSDTATSVVDDTTATTAAATATTTEAAATETAAGPGAGGPGTNVSPDSVSSVDELVDLIQEAYGDPSLGLQRGHQPVESTLIAFLGISHDEMHVRMDQGQNLEAVATDLGLDYQDLIDTLVDSWSPAIDGLLEDGTITQDETDAYLVALQEAFRFRVTWNGSDATPSFTGI